MSTKDLIGFDAHTGATLEVRNLSEPEVSVVMTEDNADIVEALMDKGIGWEVSQFTDSELEVLMKFVPDADVLLPMIKTYLKQDCLVIVGKGKISIQLKEDIC